MSINQAPSWDSLGGKKTPLTALLLYSLLFHVVLLIVIPLITQLVWKQKSYSRPATFELVTMPAPRAQPAKAPEPEPVVEKTVPPPAPPAVKPQTVPKEKAAKPRDIPENKAKQEEKEEDLSELADLLGGIQPPSAEISVGKSFTYHWYLRNVTSRIERFWRPPVTNPDLSVIVLFTIFANGTISDPSISRSSGNPTVDNMALRAVKLSAPYGKLPPGYGDNKLELRLTLRPTKK